MVCELLDFSQESVSPVFIIKNGYMSKTMGFY